MKHKLLRYLIIVFCLLLLAGLYWVFVKYFFHDKLFNGQQAYQDVLNQVAFGPRIPGSTAHTKTIEYIQGQLAQAGWQSRIQYVKWDGFEVKNIIAFRSGNQADFIIGAHYDSRILADQDIGPAGSLPVPGANDGASGVAVLLELARTLPKNVNPTWLVFFDAEDDGGIDGRSWIMGSKAFVANLTFKPKAAIIVDMVGDSHLDIYIENNSTKYLVSEIWGVAARLGYENQFIPSVKYSMEDDHTPFLKAGIPAVDIIDFDYPYWHTSADTPDKVSPASLKIVGQTILTWMSTQK